MSTDREAKIDEANALFRKADTVAGGIAAVLEHFKVIPPLPAPTPGQRIAERMIEIGTSQCLDIRHPAEPEKWMPIPRPDGDASRVRRFYVDYIAAAIDHGISEALAARATPAVDWGKVAAEFVREKDGFIVLGGIWFPPPLSNTAAHLRSVLVDIMRKALEGGAK